MNKTNFLKRYNDKDKKVQEYMTFICNSLVDKYKEIPEAFIISLDLLANNLEIMVKSVGDMNTDGGLTDDDRYHGKKKSAALQTYFQAQSYVASILASFGMNPMAKSKIKQSQQEVNAEEFLEKLTA